MLYRNLFLIVIILLSASGHCSASGDTTFFDKGWKNINSRTGAEYFRVTKKAPGGLYAVVDHFINGKVQMQGTFKYKDTVKEGAFTYYFESGNKQSEGMYKNDKREGEWKHYRDDAQPSLWYVCNFKADKYDGSFKSYYKGGKLKRDAVYKNGELVSGKQFSGAGKDIPFTEFSKMPTPPYDVMTYLSESIVYPAECRQKNVTGRVLVKFFIDADGSIKGTSVIKSVHPLIDKESIRVVAAMPKWEPGTEDDMPVKIYYTLPIKFSLK